jgi:hypothetical protein
VFAQDNTVVEINKHESIINDFITNETMTDDDSKVLIATAYLVKNKPASSALA